MARRKDKKKKEKKPGRFSRHLHTAREIHREPRSALRMIRAAFLRLWQAKGGGFYGLGYVVTFVVLEARLFAGDVVGSDSLFTFIASEALEYVFRFGLLSIVNGLLAVIWPFFVLMWLGLWAVPVLAGGYFLFERLGRPLFERWFPEMKEAREHKAREKAAKEMAASSPAQQLSVLSRTLRQLHSQILEVERRRDPQASPQEWLNRLAHDPAWAWLRPVSSLIANLDHLPAAGKDVTAEEAAAVTAQVRGLLYADDDERGDEFRRRYRPLLQESVLLASTHGELKRLLDGLPPESEAERLHARHQETMRVEHSKPGRRT